jgi:hypothetical protein
VQKRGYEFAPDGDARHGRPKPDGKVTPRNAFTTLVVLGSHREILLDVQLLG